MGLMDFVRRKFGNILVFKISQFFRRTFLKSVLRDISSDVKKNAACVCRAFGFKENIMNIDILGASGGIGGGLLTTSLRIENKILLDVGTGAGQLSREELLNIDKVFLTHAHLDHIALLPMLADLRVSYPLPSLDVFALPEVIEVLRAHIFNWKIWPDFSRLLSPENPVLRFHAIPFDQTVWHDDLQLTPFEVEHVVPCCGWIVQKNETSFVFTGDTKIGEPLFRTLKKLPDLKALMIECAFPNRLQDLANVSQHITPNDLLDVLEYIPKDCQIWISHLKPEQAEETREELLRLLPQERLIILQDHTHLYLT